MRKLLATAIVALMLSSSTPAVAAQSVSGKVVNATTGSPAAGVEVTVVHLRPDRQEVRRATATTAADGSFAVEGFDPAPDDTFVAGARYLDVTYSAAGKLNESLDISVYETTADDNVIEVVSDTLSVIQGDENVLEVLQLFRVVNRSRTTYIGNEDGVLVLPIPEGAFGLSAGEGLDESRLRRARQGALTMDPVIPGESTYTLAYKVKVARTGWSLRRPIVYPTEHIDVLVGDGLLLDAQLAFVENKKIGKITYARHRGGPFKPGAFLGVDIRYEQRGGGSAFGGLGALLIGLAAIIVLGSLWMKRRKSPAPTTTDTRQQLIDEIASLDEKFERAEIADDAYRAQRDRKMQELERMSAT